MSCSWLFSPPAARWSTSASRHGRRPGSCGTCAAVFVGVYRRPPEAHLAGMETEVSEAAGEVEEASTADNGQPFAVATGIQSLLAVSGLGVCVVWAWRDGGFAPEEWLPGGLLLLALLCVAMASAD